MFSPLTNIKNEKMIKLIMCIGFLAVFGFVAYVLVLMLTNYFKKQNENINQSIKNPKKTTQK